MDYALGAEAALEDLGVKLAEVIARVYSQSQKGKRYTVRKDDGQYSCSCPDFKYRHAGRGTHCKHIKTRIERQASDEKTAAIVYAVSPDNRTHVATQGGQLKTLLYPSLDVARQQAASLSRDVLLGSHLHPQYDNLFGQPLSARETRRLDQAGVIPRFRPSRTSPLVSVLSLDVPDDLLNTHKSHTVDEDTMRDVPFYASPAQGWSLAPGKATVVEKGLGSTRSHVMGVADSATPAEVRLRRALARRGVDPRKAVPMIFASMGSNGDEHLASARAGRKDRLRKLRQALKDAPPPPPPPSRKTPPAAAPKTPAAPSGFNWKHPAVLGVGALGLAGLGYGAYRMFDRKRKERQAADGAASAA